MFTRARTAIVRLFAKLCFVVSSFTSLSYGHEGHAPLPTKGIQVDVEKGLITLSPEAQKSLGLQTAAVEQKALEQFSLAYSTLVTPWRQQHFVGSLLAGRIAKLHVVAGETVKAGQLLAEIDSSELESLRLELRNALTEADLSTRQAERLHKLATDQVIPGREYLDALSKKEQDVNAVHIAQSKLRNLGFDDEAIGRAGSDQERLMLAVRSPIKGTVSHADLAIGKVVASNEHLFEVNDLSTLWVKIGLLERDLGRIAIGQRVELDFPGMRGKRVATTIAAEPVEVDATTHLATVWADLANQNDNPSFVPGMYGTARIITSDDQKFLTLPTSALLGSGAERYVLVEVAATAKGFEYRRQNVVVVNQNSTETQVRGGLFPGDRVVRVGGQVLSSFFVLGSLRLSPEGIRNVGLRVESVTRKVVEEVIALQGIVDLPPGQFATVSTQVVGTLSRVHVDRGAAVTAGQIVGELSGVSLQDTQLSLVRYDLEARLLDSTLQRVKTNDPVPLIATRRIWEMESARDTAINRREAARQTLQTIGFSAKDVEEILKTRQPRAALPIRAPIGGVVVRLNKALGEVVAADEPIFEIHDLSRPWIKAALSEVEASKVRVGTGARIRLVSDPEFLAQAKAVQSARSISVESRSLSLWLELTSPAAKPLQRNLLSQVSATVGQSQPVLAVPLSAVVRDQTRNFVFIQKPGGLMERRPVELGRMDDRYAEITRGLSEGEQIAVQGAAELQTTYASVR